MSTPDVCCFIMLYLPHYQTYQPLFLHFFLVYKDIFLCLLCAHQNLNKSLLGASCSGHCWLYRMCCYIKATNPLNFKPITQTGMLVCCWLFWQNKNTIFRFGNQSMNPLFCLHLFPPLPIIRRSCIRVAFILNDAFLKQCCFYSV